MNFMDFKPFISPPVYLPPPAPKPLQFHARSTHTSPVVDIASLRLELVLLLSEIVHVHIPQSQDAFSPTGQLPCISIDDVFYGDVDAEMVAGRVGLGFMKGRSLDACLTTTEAALAFAARSLLDNDVRFALEYELWCIPANFNTLTTQARGVGYPFPLNLIIPNLERSKIVATMKAIHPVLKPSSIYLSASKAFTTLSTILSDKEFMFGDVPCTLDALVYAYIHTIVKTFGTSSRLVTMAKSHGNLNRLMDRLLSRITKSIVQTPNISIVQTPNIE